MKKILSLVAMLGILGALSASAFAADEPKADRPGTGTGQSAADDCRSSTDRQVSGQGDATGGGKSDEDKKAGDAK